HRRTGNQISGVRIFYQIIDKKGSCGLHLWISASAQEVFVIRKQIVLPEMHAQPGRTHRPKPVVSFPDGSRKMPDIGRMMSHSSPCPIHLARYLLSPFV